MVVFSSYELNKEYISSVFCINKEHPELHCDGQCFLAKKLNELEHQNKQTQDNLKKLIESVPEFKSYALCTLAPTFELKTYSGYFVKPIIKNSFSLFHPPKSLV